jgi:GGDEF domain-containing protein
MSEGAVTATDEWAAPPAVQDPRAAGMAGLAGVPAPAFALHPPRSGKGLDPRSADRLAARLEALLAHHRALPARRGKGGLFVVDISELARRFVKRWPAAREKAYQLVEGILVRRLGADDLYLALSGERFLLLLTDLERAAAELLARRIASEITDRLCGMIPEGVACRLRSLPGDLEAGLAGGHTVAALETLVAAAETPASIPGEAVLASLAATLEPRFTPVINVKKRLVSIHALTPRASVGGPGCLDRAPTAAGEEQRAALDRWLVGQAAQLLGSPACRAAVLVPIAYSTIACMRHREPLMLACRRLPAAARRRLLVELEGLPPSLPQPRLRELVGYLRPFTVGTVVRLAPARLAGGGACARNVTQSMVEQLAGSGIAGLSLDLAAGLAESGGEDRAPALLGTFASVAGRLGLRTVCHVGADPGLCRAALAAGIDHLLGEVLLPSTRHPGRVVALGHGAA